MFMMKGSILMIIKNHDRRNNSVFKHGIIPSIKLLALLANYIANSILIYKEGFYEIFFIVYFFVWFSRVQ